MSRPRKRRTIRFSPNTHYYKPRGIPLRFLEEVEISYEEMESLRLTYKKKLDQTEGAKKMKISQPTFHRHLDKALQKMSLALLEGKAIRIVDKSDKLSKFKI